MLMFLVSSEELLSQHVNQEFVSDAARGCISHVGMGGGAESFCGF